MKPVRGIAALYLILATIGCATISPREPEVVAAMRELERHAEAGLWPGFDPMKIPAAVFDGNRTYLFRHPSPPEGFVALEGAAETHVFEGRHPAVSANSSALIGDVLTATVMTMAESLPPSRKAGLIAHEMFHVHQQTNHPEWSANEVDLFEHPIGDHRLLAVQLMESESMRKALASRGKESICWTRTALAFRLQRIALLAPAAATYIRRTELNEGIPTYVQHRVGKPEDARATDAATAASSPRQSAYRSGYELALLLDIHAPGWRSDLIRDKSAMLDTLLLQAVGSSPAEGCGFTQKERQSIEAEAAVEARAAIERLRESREQFLQAGGWTLVIDATDSTLFPSRFDPWNVDLVGDGEVLHGRHIVLSNEGSSVEVLGRASLTASAGEHPMFNGLKRLTVTGLPSAPAIQNQDESFKLTAEGVTASFSRAAVSQEGRVFTVTLR